MEVEQFPLFHSRPFTTPHTFTDGIEGPACDSAQNVYAVNHTRPGTIGRITPDGTSECWLRLPGGSIGNGIVFGPNGELYIADYVGHTIFKVDRDSCAISVYVHEPKMSQPNDLAIAADRTIYASDPDWPSGTGQVWRINLHGKAVLLERDMGTTNGIEVSPNERTLYVNETLQRSVWAYERASDGGITNKRLFYQFPDFGLDGMRCDAAGNLFVTRHGKGAIAKIAPTGELLREIHLGGLLCTNIAFGGADGCTCYVTIADQGMIEWFRVDIPGRSWCLWSKE